MSNMQSRAELEQRLAALESERLALRETNEAMQTRLDEAEQTLDAIRSGEVDALVVNTPDGDRLFSLQDADRPYRGLIEQMQEGALTLFPDGRIHYCNLAFATMLKQPLEAVIGTHIEQYVAESDRPMIRTMLERCETGGSRGATHLLASDDSLIPVHVSLTLIVNPNDSQGSICMVVTNLTERQRAEQVLASEQFIRRMVDHAPMGVAVVDRQFRYLMANPAYRAIAGGAAVVGRTIAEVFSPEVTRIVEAAVQQVFQKGQPIEFREYEAPVRDRIWWNVHVIPLHDADKQVEAVLILAEDVTDQKHAVKTLEQSKQRLALGVQTAGLALAEIDYTTGIYHLTAEAARLFGLGDAAINVPHQVLHATFLPEDRAELARRIAASMAPAGVGEFGMNLRIIAPNDGRVRWLRVRKQVIFEGQGNNRRPVRAMLAALDVTAEREAEQAARRSEEFVRGVLNSLPEHVAVLDKHGTIIAVNEPWRRFARENGGSASGAKIAVGANYLEVCRRASAEGDAHATLALSRLEDVLAGRNETCFVEYPCHSPEQRRWFLMNARHIASEEFRVVLSHVNITERKRAEEALRDLNLTLEQRVAQRTAEVDQRAHQLQALAAELTRAEEQERRRLAQVLHDGLQQILVAIKMRAGMVQRCLHDKNAPAILQEIESLTGESIEMTRSLTADLSPAVLRDRGLAAGLVWLAREMNEKHDITVEVHTEPGTEPDSEEIRSFVFQATRELVFNARKHSGASRVEISLSAPSGRVRVIVRDHGCGFDPTRIQNRPITGGFGLFSLRERLTYLGGTIVIDSAPGQGTCIIMEVPVRLSPSDRNDSPQPANPLQAASQPMGNSIRVLLVDDHKIVREGFAMLLAEVPDIEVVGQASDGLEAIELTRKLRPHLVVMDITMPNLQGTEATRQITTEMPATKVIGLSMHDEGDMTAAMKRAGAVAYLRKDGPADELIRTIRRAVCISTARGSSP